MRIQKRARLGRVLFCLTFLKKSARLLIMKSEVKIKDVTLKSPFTLAPMAGFTDVGFRSICAEAGAGLTVTEMISVRGLLYGQENTKDLLVTQDNETPKAVQVFTNEPDLLRDAVAHPLLQKFDIIDINMGCPMPKIAGNGMGSSLLKNVDLAKYVVQSAVLNTKKPVTVKMRVGINGMTVSPLEFALAMQDAGASALVVHGRTREQMYTGQADWDTIEQIASNLKIPVFGNGDVWTPADALQRLNTTSCAGVCIGRGALGNPFIFSQLTNTKFNYTPMQVIKKHFDILLKYQPLNIVLPYMRKHLGYYIKSIKGCKEIRDKINRSLDLNEIMDLLSLAFAENEKK